MFNLIAFIIIVAMLTVLVTQYFVGEDMVREDRVILLDQTFNP